MEKLGGIIWDITKYLCVCVKQDVNFICDLEENLQSLENKWENLEAMKKDVEEQIEEAESTGEMRRSYQVIVWLKSIQDIQEEVKEIQVQGAQEIQNKCLSKCCPKNCMSSFRLGKNVANMLTKVDHLTAEGQRFGKDYQITQKLPHKPIDQIPLNDTVGLDFTFSKVWDDGIEANKVGVIGLYGTGGVGKTTLMKKICNELVKRRPDFFVILVVVSKERNLEKIMDNIRKSIGIGDSIWNSCSNQEEKSAKIWGVLKQKKFALLLDDIWEELDLNSVGVPYPKDTNFESKVLFTTRLEDVCEKMQAQMSFKVEFLKEMEALELFHMKVGEETLNSHPRIKVLAKEIAAECKGLPLALIVAGSAMAGVKSVEVWECSKNNLSSSSWTTSNIETRVFSILKLSYDLLPDETHKNCFLYCALYPEDYEIRVNDIIDKWIGEGLLCTYMEKGIQGICNYGQSVIAKLKLCCLLESVEDDIAVARSFKMHDMVRDMALWLAYCDQDKRMKRVLVQGDAITSHDDVEKLKIVERISIMKAEEVWNVPPVTCPNLVTLLLRCYKIEGLQHIKYFCKLKVLELYANNVYNPREIGELILLEYLSLKIVGVEFPEELKNLKNLKLFNLYCTEIDIESIPLEVISSLLQLRVLRVYTPFKESSKAEVEFLKVVESLPRIEELNVDITTEDGLNKLLHSHKLQSCIDALCLFDTPIKSMACISKLKRLRLFSMYENFVEDYCIYDTSCCLTMLQCVAIIGCRYLKHATWLKHAPFLQMLLIDGCSSMEQVVKQEEEAIRDENADSSSSSCITTTTFSSLVNLTIIDLPKLQSIHETALSFPYLRNITISYCPNLKKLPLDSNSAKHGKLTRIDGEEDWWNELEWDDPPAKHRFQSKFSSKFIDVDISQDLYNVIRGLDWTGFPQTSSSNQTSIGNQLIWT